ncbi:hypothetical protein AAHA92_13464 [Salvia divinorum]|uniref:Uncharacterized protein n=1 Tax=Salvia divinorum TaxID=28513 RepID=A0ABD1H8D5_SALDI
MPYSLPVLSNFRLEQLILSRTWSKFASGQISTSTGIFHSKKSLIGGFLSLEIFFLFLLSIALSEELPTSPMHCGCRIPFQILNLAVRTEVCKYSKEVYCVIKYY